MSLVHLRKWANILCLIANHSCDDLIQGAFHGQCVSLKCGLAPSELTLIIGDLHKQPTGLDSEVFNRLDARHFGVYVQYYQVNCQRSPVAFYNYPFIHAA